MKKLNLFIMSFSQNIISSIIMLIILSFALISMQDVIGQYRYITYSRYIIENQYLQNSDYFMINPEIMMVPDSNGLYRRPPSSIKCQSYTLLSVLTTFHANKVLYFCMLSCQK